MRRSSLIVFLVFLCACETKTDLFITHWKKSLPETNRSLASDGVAHCVRDDFTLENVKKEIADAEAAYANGTRVKGKWRHLSLAALPIPAASFLKAYGDKLGDGTQDFSGCEDVPCVFNRVYGKGDSIEGYVHYLWYLRTGTYLAADKLVPQQISEDPGVFGGKPHPLSDYLFSSKELFGFWRLSKMLRAPHTALTNLREIQRLPKGSPFEQETYKNACGLASSAGWIQLADGCLAVDSYDRDFGYLYTAVTHEMSHQIDYLEGASLGKASRSEQSDYLVFTGLEIEEFVDTDHVLKRRWKRLPDAKLVTDYAGTSPMENFAESLAYFRHQGDRTKRSLGQEHYQFVSDHYYQKRKFEASALFSSWISGHAIDLSTTATKAIMDCSQSTETPSTYFQAADFGNKIARQTVSCLGARAAAAANDLRMKISADEVDACALLKSSPATWDEEYKRAMLKPLNEKLEAALKDHGYLSRVARLEGDLGNEEWATKAYLACSQETDRSICYPAKVRELLTPELTSIPESEVATFVETYLRQFPESKVSAKLTEDYAVFFRSHAELITSKAKLIWDGCKLNPDDRTPPTGTTFTPGEGYLVSSIHSCVNFQLGIKVSELLQSFTVDGFTIGDPHEEQFARAVLTPMLTRSVTELYESDAKKESDEGLRWFADHKRGLAQQMASNFSWVNLSDPSKSCREELLKRIDVSLTFHLKRDFFQSASFIFCTTLLGDAEYGAWLTQEKPRIEAELVAKMNARVLEIAGNVARRCLERFPNDSQLHRYMYLIQRNTCLLSEWGDIEKTAREEQEANELVNTLDINLEGNLELTRKENQKKIRDQYF